MPKCEISNETVNWVLSKEFITKIKKSLLSDPVEIAGKILFEDDVHCTKKICNKKSSKTQINKGDNSSVSTPNGIINFHTHPKICYTDTGSIYGWPSGEDMRQCISFAKNGNLIHVVFTWKEGAYIIKVNNILTRKSDINILEKLLQMTHTFRSKNPITQNRLFLDMIRIIIPRTNKLKTPEKTWLYLINNLSLNTLYKIYNDYNGTNMKVPADSSKIFSVQLLKMGETVKFNTNYINETCHRESFQ